MIGDLKPGHVAYTTEGTARTDACHCGKHGHPLNSVNCPVHGYYTVSKGQIPDNFKPMVVLAKDANGNVFEAHVLRCQGRNLYIDVRAAEAIVGGIASLRNGISPYHEIVCEVFV